MITQDSSLVFTISQNPPVMIGRDILRAMLVDPNASQAENIERALFFGNWYKLDAQQLGDLFSLLNLGGVLDALLEGGHSVDLQPWLDDIGYSERELEQQSVAETVGVYDPNATPPEFLPELWKNAQVKVLSSLAELADGLTLEVLSKLPSDQAQMNVAHYARLNRNGTIGISKPEYAYQQQMKVGIVYDCSSSMGRTFAEKATKDVAALSHQLNADIILVSTYAERLTAGTFSVKDVLDHWQNGGTRYGTLAPYFQEDWDVIVAIADYDSHWGAQATLSRCKGKIGHLFDISVVPMPTFLSECLAPLAAEVTPLFIGGQGLDYRR